jgi:hypothetical protein
MVVGQDLNLRPSGYEPEGLFLPVFGEERLESEVLTKTGKNKSIKP